MTSHFKRSLKSIALATAALGCVVAAPQAAHAGELHNGWNYAIDSFNDGTEGNTIGGKSAFEFYGLAYQETADSVIFAINSNLHLDGDKAEKARGGAIGYGDLFINFGGGSFADAEGTDNLYAVNFADNDSDLSTGLYSNVTSQSLTTQNVGYSTIQSHTNKVEKLQTDEQQQQLKKLEAEKKQLKKLEQKQEKLEKQLKQLAKNPKKQKQLKKQQLKKQQLKEQQQIKEQQIKELEQLQAKELEGVSHGDLTADSTYFNKNAGARTNIATGNYESSITMLDSFDGLDFGHFNATGDYTYGFSIDKTKLKMGDFVANFFAECGNDGIAIAGKLTGMVAVPEDPDTKAVPESSSTAGLLVIGMMAGGAILRKRRAA